MVWHGVMQCDVLFLDYLEMTIRGTLHSVCRRQLFQCKTRHSSNICAISNKRIP